ncbi:DUF2538 family protein [Priestia aryabhattai]|uniref:DUF2538 family protein n=1 Tax=Priestia aryabhattai TaxID=412384 RepID=UPI002E1E9885|nr:DUF2538 family protein [Priestia aryabhattai]
MNHIWFKDEQHKKNYKELSLRFPEVTDSKEYEVTCYLASFPSIYNRFEVTELEDGPLDWFFREIDKGTSRIYSLKDWESDFHMVLAAASFWNNYKGFRLGYSTAIWTDDYYRTFQQACKLWRENR